MIDREKLLLVTAEMKRLLLALEKLPQPIVGGQAAALGTLTAIHRRFDALVNVLEGREAKGADRSDIVNAISSLKWLSEDRHIRADLTDGVPLEGFDSYSGAIANLIAATSLAID